LPGGFFYPSFTRMTRLRIAGTSCERRSTWLQVLSLALRSLAARPRQARHVRERTLSDRPTLHDSPRVARAGC